MASSFVTSLSIRIRSGDTAKPGKSMPVWPASSEYVLFPSSASMATMLPIFEKDEYPELNLLIAEALADDDLEEF